MTVTVVRDQRFQDHDPGSGHPECPERLQSIDERLDASGLALHLLEPRAATREECVRVHTADYLDRIDAVRGRRVALDPDTRTSEGSHEAAMLAAGSAIDLVQGVADGKLSPGLALVRPPGHHATSSRAMGFCLINHVAVAARALIDSGRAERVAIYDFDVHHGNGTEEIFYQDDQVLYLSTHQWPFYPGTGKAEAVGRGRGEGFTVNVPLPAGTGDEALLRVSEELLFPKVERFEPDFILLSAGFDPYELDPIGGFSVTVEGFRTLAGRWRELAEKRCQGRIAGVLEGGYHLEGLASSVVAVLEAWA